MTKFAPKALKQPAPPKVKAAAKPKLARFTDPNKAFVAEMNKKPSVLGKAFAAYKPASVKGYNPPKVSRTSS